MAVETQGKTKKCGMCGDVKSQDDFYFFKWSNGELGARHLCKECWQKYKKEHPQWNRQARTNWRLANPERVRTEMQFNRYMVANKITRPLLCANCGKPTKTQAHHPDITKPLEVCWCCQTCHQKIERGEVLVSPRMITTYPF